MRFVNGHVPGVRLAVSLLALVLTATSVAGQEVRPIPAVADRTSLGAVEAEGRSHSPLPPSHVDPGYWRENAIPGSADRICIDVPGRQPVRSGDFTIWYDSHGSFRAGTPHKIAWAPAENARDMELRVRGRHIGNTNAVFDWTSSDTALPVRKDRGPEGIDDYFFPSMTGFPEAGEWVVVVTSGRNWGCFIFSVQEADRS